MARFLHFELQLQRTGNHSCKGLLGHLGFGLPALNQVDARIPNLNVGDTQLIFSDQADPAQLLVKPAFREQ
ncbi:MAG: hypothetical protein GY850_37540 [bacterium]|nr:hypothetical protein [bacterium]